MQFLSKSNFHEALKFLIYDKNDISRTTKNRTSILNFPSTHAEISKISKIRRLMQKSQNFRVEIEMVTIWNDVRWQKTKLLELKDTWNRSNIS